MTRKIRFLQEGKSVINTFTELLDEAMRATETEITVSEMPETRIISGDLTEYRSNEGFMREFLLFCTSSHEPKLNTSFPIGGYFENIQTFLKEPSRPTRFFSIDPKGNDMKPAGLYLIGYTRGYYGQTNDTYHRVWNAIPPERPNSLRAFVGRITRNLSLDRLEKENRKKRGGGQFNALLSELEECIADGRNSFDELIETETITAVLNAFLSEQSAENRRIFVRRYWRAASIEDIAADFNMSVGKVKTTLFRMRNKLRKHLESEGIFL